MDDGHAEDARRNSLLQFFANNPWVGALGSLASIVGIPLGIYFFLQSVSKSDLVYYLNPVRTVIVKQGAASRLAVSFDGHALSEDVTAAQVAIWNRGRRAIKTDAVLRPVIIKTEPPAVILEATVRTTSREVVSLHLDSSQFARGEVAISWNILEQSDGGVVQLVYSAGPNVRIRCVGVLEGQPEIRELKYSGTIKSPADQVAEDKWLNTVSGFFLFVAVIAVPYLFRFKKRYPGRWDIVDVIFLIIGPSAAIVALVYLTFVYSVPRPPFGFQ